MGEKIPKAIREINKTNNKGVRKFPMISTTLEGEMVNSQVTAKKTIEVHIGAEFGNEGNMPTSKVVAAVLGIAINGPIHNIITDPKTGDRNLLILEPKS